MEITPAHREFDLVCRAASHLGPLFAAANVGWSHGLDHALKVAGHAIRALDAGPAPASAEEREAVVLAALLHDADDRKFFPENGAQQNARRVLAELGHSGPLAELVLRMVGWVSASANGDRVPAEAEGRPWLLYPRHADRLVALGEAGLARCWEYVHEMGQPLFTENTLRAADEEDLWRRVATPERYAAYRGASASMIDHFYDKLLRLGRAIEDCGNAYLCAEARDRAGPIVEIALEFGRDGEVGLARFMWFLRLAADEKQANMPAAGQSMADAHAEVDR